MEPALKFVTSPVGVPDWRGLLHMNEIRTPYHRDKISIRRRAITGAHCAYMNTGAALAVLTWMRGCPAQVRAGAIPVLRRVRQADQCNLGLRCFHNSPKIPHVPTPVNRIVSSTHPGTSGSGPMATKADDLRPSAGLRLPFPRSRERHSLLRERLRSGTRQGRLSNGAVSPMRLQDLLISHTRL